MLQEEEEEEEEEEEPPHLHCFSIQGEPYVSIFPHTEKGEQSGRSASESWTDTLSLIWCRGAQW